MFNFGASGTCTREQRACSTMKGCDYTAQQHGGAHGAPACRGRGAREAACARRVLCGQPVCPGHGGRTVACAQKAQHGPRQAVKCECARAYVQQRGHRNVTLSHVRAHTRARRVTKRQTSWRRVRPATTARPRTRCAHWRFGGLAQASNTHRQVRDDQTSGTAGKWGTGKGVRRWVKGENVHGVIPCSRGRRGLRPTAAGVGVGVG